MVGIYWRKDVRRSELRRDLGKCRKVGKMKERNRER